jgi:uncharacterized protein YjiS (DUF1127 family)
MAYENHDIVDDHVRPPNVARIHVRPPNVARILRGWRAGEPASVQAGSGIVLRRLGAILLSWMARARQRRALGELDARLLEDIGVTREAAERESAKPFWHPGEDARQPSPRPGSATVALLHLQRSPIGQ